MHRLQEKREDMATVDNTLLICGNFFVCLHRKIIQKMWNKSVQISRLCWAQKKKPETLENRRCPCFGSAWRKTRQNAICKEGQCKEMSLYFICWCIVFHCFTLVCIILFTFYCCAAALHRSPRERIVGRCRESTPERGLLSFTSSIYWHRWTAASSIHLSSTPSIDQHIID